MVRDVRKPSLADSPSLGVLTERAGLANHLIADPGPSSRRMSRSKAGPSSKATPRTSTRQSGRKLTNLLSSEANETPIMTRGRRAVQATPTMMRADETMLYDIAPPPDMPSSSLFGDESDDDMDSSPRPAAGNAVKGRGNLLTPVNSTLVSNTLALLAPPASRTDHSLRRPQQLGLQRLVQFGRLPQNLSRKSQRLETRRQLRAEDAPQLPKRAMLNGLELRLLMPTPWRRILQLLLRRSRAHLSRDNRLRLLRGNFRSPPITLRGMQHRHDRWSRRRRTFVGH